MLTIDSRPRTQQRCIDSSDPWTHRPCPGYKPIFGEENGSPVARASDTTGPEPTLPKDVQTSGLISPFFPASLGDRTGLDLTPCEPTALHYLRQKVVVTINQADSLI